MYLCRLERGDTMDPITHALVGAAVAGLSGGEVSITNPVYLGAIMGAVAPDLDIVYQLRGDVQYLKQHRGFSHSIPGLALISGGIAAGLVLFFPEYAFIQLFFWTMLGALSHTLLDILNSYGAQIFGPYSQKRYSLNLLMITDPILFLILFGVFLLPGSIEVKSLVGIIGFMIYLGFRLYLRLRVENLLKSRYRNSSINKLAVMPSMMSLWTWDFLVETDKKYFIGQVYSFNCRLKIKRKLIKPKMNQIIENALASKLGQFFKEFTPHYFIDFKKTENDEYVINFLDLRYCLKKGFLHTATMAFDKKYQQVEAIFHPYSKARKVDIV